MRINIRLVGRSVVALVAMTSLAAAATDLRLVALQRIAIRKPFGVCSNKASP